MDIRDQFAGMAMQGLLVNADEDFSREGVAIMAYQMADAMLGERGRDATQDVVLTGQLIDATDIGLSVRTVNSLQSNDIYTYDQLAAKTERELLRLCNFGRKSVNEVKDALAAKGINIKYA